MTEVNVIGAGLAGSEAALQLAKRGFKVNLYEMRPQISTGAHKTDKFAEFVCSNSLGANSLNTCMPRLYLLPVRNFKNLYRPMFSKTKLSSFKENSYLPIFKSTGSSF